MSVPALQQLRQVIAKHWGYHSFRPLQEPAMCAVLDGRDSLVVLPTGGGKSLCYQAPAIVQGGTTVVVSPLIALMKDQVDALQACGVAAVQINSSLTPGERSASEREVLQGAVCLLFVSPERMALDDFCHFLRRINVRTFAIDEAHCISHWGHDFRPEYRQLKRLKQIFPEASVHGYTATATERVRRDVCEQLGLHQPEVLVGNFDRPNLNYRVLPKLDENRQVEEVLRRHEGEAGIVYCIRRAEVDELAHHLKQRGFKVAPYHAGMDSAARKAAQDAFAAEQIDIVVATVAFGMGIDRSNIRFVLHTGMPKSVEHYQQETGRAGRDRLEAECVLLYSGADFMTWKWLVEKSAKENAANPDYLRSAIQHLREMDRYCQGAVCRHKSLVEYFGQGYDAPTCQACDICLGDTEPVPDADVVAQKILSCVARVEQRFGVAHVVDVLRGANTEKMRQFRHEALSTYGLLKERSQMQVRNWIYQLLSQGMLVQDSGDRPVLKLNDVSWQVMKKQRAVRLVQPPLKADKASRADQDFWTGVDRALLDQLMKLRRDLAAKISLPPHVIFTDNVLRDMARIRPSTLDSMRSLYGIGEKKLRDYGEDFLAIINAHCGSHQLAMDIFPESELDYASRLPHSLAPLGRTAERFAEISRTAPVPDAQVVAQKIVSCVARVKGRFRAGHIVRILRGRNTEAIQRFGHEKLSTFGLLKEYHREQIRDWIFQLIDQKVLLGAEHFNPVLCLNEASWEVMRGQRSVELMQSPTPYAAGQDPALWEGVDRPLFEALRHQRDRYAAEKQLSPRHTLGDWVLRDLARVRPSTLERMRFLSGLGPQTCAGIGEVFVGLILKHSREGGLALDVPAPLTTRHGSAPTAPKPNSDADRAWQLFRQHATIDAVMSHTGKARSTVIDYLANFIRCEKPRSIDRWLAADEYAVIAAAAKRVGLERLKPIFLALGEKVPYDRIRLVVAHLQAMSAPVLNG